jgi:plasmid stability protein
MATLYVENVPDSLYKSLRKQAQKNGKSIAAEVISLLKENVRTEEEMKRRQEFAKRLRELSAQAPLIPGPFPSAEEMVREDRER